MPTIRTRTTARRPSAGATFVPLAMAVALSVPGMATSPAADPSPRVLFADAERLFLDARPVEAARAFDRLVEAAPGVEPGLWQRGLAFYCVARLEGVAAARAALLPVGDDTRVPMREILDLYAGRCGPEAVLEAADRGAGEARRNQLCHAHLYIGLHHEVAGDADRAREHILEAAGPFHMNHYMGEVAVVHARLRGWPEREPR